MTHNFIAKGIFSIVTTSLFVLSLAMDSKENPALYSNLNSSQQRLEPKNNLFIEFQNVGNNIRMTLAGAYADNRESVTLTGQVKRGSDDAIPMKIVLLKKVLDKIDEKIIANNKYTFDTYNNGKKVAIPDLNMAVTDETIAGGKYITMGIINSGVDRIAFSVSSTSTTGVMGYIRGPIRRKTAVAVAKRLKYACILAQMSSYLACYNRAFARCGGKSSNIKSAVTKEINDLSDLLDPSPSDCLATCEITCWCDGEIDCCPPSETRCPTVLGEHRCITDKQKCCNNQTASVADENTECCGSGIVSKGAACPCPTGQKSCPSSGFSSACVDAQTPCCDTEGGRYLCCRIKNTNGTTGFLKALNDGRRCPPYP